MLKQPVHLTSMKKLLGDCTSLLSLCFLFSSSAGGFSRSISAESTCGRTCAASGRPERGRRAPARAAQPPPSLQPALRTRRPLAPLLLPLSRLSPADAERGRFDAGNLQKGSASSRRRQKHKNLAQVASVKHTLLVIAPCAMELHACRSCALLPVRPHHSGPGPCAAPAATTAAAAALSCTHSGAAAMQLARAHAMR